MVTMTGALTLYVIYDHPRDYPGHFVLREFYVKGGRRYANLQCQLADTLDEARAMLPAGTFNLGREPDADPVIAETWV